MSIPKPMTRLCLAILVVGILLVLLILIYVYWNFPPPTPPDGLTNYKEPSRDALALKPDASGDSADEIVYLPEQGWSPRQSMDFYTRTQGSRLVPYAWFLALERPNDETPLSDPANMDRLRYLPQKPNRSNPDGLPVGFAKDPKRSPGDVEWLGFTCAACHTAQINYQNVGYRIDGGPALADHEAFMHELTRALNATLNNPAKFDRFAQKVLGKGASAEEKARLGDQLDSVHRFRADFDARNRSNHPPGYARLDAFGRILNEVLVTALEIYEANQVHVLDAPVSYPHLWDTPHHDFVQWNGIAVNEALSSRTFGALTRNVGEVLGVFGEISIPKSGLNLRGYDSSVRIRDLMDIENLVSELKSPLWPGAFPPIDPVKRDKGKVLFGEFCARCHDPKFDRAAGDRKVKAVLTLQKDLMTDDAMATNFDRRRGKTGRLEGRFIKSPVEIDLFKGEVRPGPRFEATGTGDDLLQHVVLRVIQNAAFNQYKESDLLKYRRPSGANAAAPNLVYKARPLNGIWATAPFLHNGSVANLYELLLPGDKRMPEFYVGRREFDPVHVGFVTRKSPGATLFRTKDDSGNPIRGNSNAGHEYGTGKDGKRELTSDERWQLVEYMKSL